MKKFVALTLAIATCATFNALAQSTYTTTNGEVNLIAGLTSLTSATAINTTNQSVGIDYITDSSWSTGIANLGSADEVTGGITNVVPNNGILAGTFGGGNYFAGLNNIILIGNGGGTTPAWGGWTLRLLLSNDSYSSAIGYTNSDAVYSPGVTTATNTSFFQNRDGQVFELGALNTFYQMLDIATFDTGNIGVKGIEISAITASYPDIAYIGVAQAIPEPSTYALLALSAAGLGGYFLRRRRE